MVTCFFLLIHFLVSEDYELPKRLSLVIKLRNFDFEGHWNTLIFFGKKKWCQIRLCPVKQYLISFKLHCLSNILAISWEIRILNFVKIVCFFFNLGICCQIKIFPSFFVFCLICIFWHYYRNSFELKKFLLIIRCLEIL